MNRYLQHNPFPDRIKRLDLFVGISTYPLLDPLGLFYVFVVYLFWNTSCFNISLANNKLNQTFRRKGKMLSMHTGLADILKVCILVNTPSQSKQKAEYLKYIDYRWNPICALETSAFLFWHGSLSAGIEYLYSLFVFLLLTMKTFILI